MGLYFMIHLFGFLEVWL